MVRVRMGSTMDPLRSIKPPDLHVREELVRKDEARCIRDDAIDTSPWAERGLPDTVGAVVAPLGELARGEYLAAMEAPGTCGVPFLTARSKSRSAAVSAGSVSGSVASGALTTGRVGDRGGSSPGERSDTGALPRSPSGHSWRARSRAARAHSRSPRCTRRLSCARSGRVTSRLLGAERMQRAT
jgi:hypothetical protein